VVGSEADWSHAISKPRAVATQDTKTHVRNVGAAQFSGVATHGFPGAAYGGRAAALLLGGEDRLRPAEVIAGVRERLDVQLRSFSTL
jgi:hypothetical protein